MKRWIAALLVCASIAGIFSGCGKKTEDVYEPTGDALLMEGQEPEVTIPDDPALQSLTLAYAPERSMNPLIGLNLSNRLLFSLIYQGLFAVDSRSVAHPILASGYKLTPDRKTATVIINPMARFSDGSRVTPEDVYATYAAAKKSDYFGGHFSHIADFQVSGTDSITFYLDTPFENFPVLLDIPILKEGHDQDDFPVGTGPYTFRRILLNPPKAEAEEEETEQETEEAEDVPTETTVPIGASDLPAPDTVEEIVSANARYEYSLAKVTNWWCAEKVTLPTQADTIQLVVADSQTEIRDNFQFNGLGMAAANPMTDSYAEYRCDYELWECENGIMLYLGVNVLYSDFFKNNNFTLRRALTKAIDREYINNTFFNGKCQPTAIPTAPNSVYYSKSLAAGYTYDPLGFVSDIAGYNFPRDDKNQKKKLKLLVNANDSARLRTARYLAAQLTELGVETGVLEYGATGKYTYTDILRAGTYDLYLGEVRLNPTYDLTEFFRSGGKLSWGGIVDGDILAMQREALADRGNYYNLNKLVADDGKIIPILFGTTCIYANRGSLLDQSPSRDNAFFYTLGASLEDIRIQTEADAGEN